MTLEVLDDYEPTLVGLTAPVRISFPLHLSTVKYPLIDLASFQPKTSFTRFEMNPQYSPPKKAALITRFFGKNPHSLLRTDEKEERKG